MGTRLLIGYVSVDWVFVCFPGARLLIGYSSVDWVLVCFFLFFFLLISNPQEQRGPEIPIPSGLFITFLSLLFQNRPLRSPNPLWFSAAV